MSLAQAVYDSKDHLSSLPTELLHHVISEVTADNIDRTITKDLHGPFDYPKDNKAAPALSESVYHGALLGVSRRIRQITSQVLRMTIGAKFDAFGWLTENPWCLVKAVSERYQSSKIPWESDTTGEPVAALSLSECPLLRLYARLAIYRNILWIAFRAYNKGTLLLHLSEQTFSTDFKCQDDRYAPQEVLGWRVGRRVDALSSMSLKIRTLWALGQEVDASQARLDLHSPGTPEYQAEAEILHKATEAIWAETSKPGCTGDTIELSSVRVIVEEAAARELDSLSYEAIDDPIALAIMEHWAVRFPSLGISHLLCSGESQLPSAPQLGARSKAALVRCTARLLQSHIERLKKEIEKKEASGESVPVLWLREQQESRDLLVEVVFSTKERVTTRTRSSSY